MGRQRRSAAAASRPRMPRRQRTRPWAEVASDLRWERPLRQRPKMNNASARAKSARRPPPRIRGASSREYRSHLWRLRGGVYSIRLRARRPLSVTQNQKETCAPPGPRPHAPHAHCLLGILLRTPTWRRRHLHMREMSAHSRATGGTEQHASSVSVGEWSPHLTALGGKQRCASGRRHVPRSSDEHYLTRFRKPHPLSSR